MFDEAVTRRLSANIVKWMMVQIDKSAPETMFEWAYDIGMDRTWEIVGSALTRVGVFSETEGRGRRIEYKSLIHFQALDSEINCHGDDFKNLFLAFLVLGSFFGYLPKYSFQGFKAEESLSSIFSDLNELGFCASKAGYWFWDAPKFLAYIRDTSEYDDFIRPIFVDCFEYIEPRDIEIMDKLKNSWQEYTIIWRLISPPSSRPWYI